MEDMGFHDYVESPKEEGNLSAMWQRSTAVIHSSVHSYSWEDSSI